MLGKLALSPSLFTVKERMGFVIRREVCLMGKDEEVKLIGERFDLTGVNFEGRERGRGY